MITREQMFEPLLQVAPSFVNDWNAFVRDWQGEPDPPEYLALADFARHLVRKLESKDTAEFEAVFDVVECWMVEGDDYVKTAAAVGLLENLQNSNFHKTTSPDDFLIRLRPQSRRWWDKVEAFWRDGTIIRNG